MYVVLYVYIAPHQVILISSVEPPFGRYMVKNGYDFYENSFLNGVFKRLVSVAAKGINAEDLKTSDSFISSSPSSSLKDIVETLEEAVRSSNQNQKDNDGLVANTAYTR